MKTPMQRLGELSREYAIRANDYSDIAIDAARAEADYRQGKAAFMARAMIGDGASAAKAEVMANADETVHQLCLSYKVTAAAADAAKSKLTQLRESVATGRTMIVQEREQDKLHTQGFTGAA